MLVEIKNIRQESDSKIKRWFSSENIDLFIWIEDEQVSGFQICYDKRAQEKALSWTKSKGLQHQLVDDGEQRPGKYKSTPMLQGDEEYDLKIILQLYKDSIEHQLEEELKDFILSCLQR